MSEWDYGGQWGENPIEPGEVWVEEKTGSAVMVRDIYEGVPGFMTMADMVYTDPPWNTSNINSFYTKAGKRETRRDHRRFIDVLFHALSLIDPKVVYMEMGWENWELVEYKTQDQFQAVQHWSITYYGNNPAVLIRGGNDPTDHDFTGEDDADTPGIAMDAEEFEAVADLCMGRGLVGISAFNRGKRFYGTELNKKRLACLVDKVERAGGKFTKYEVENMDEDKEAYHSALKKLKGRDIDVEGKLEGGYTNGNSSTKTWDVLEALIAPPSISVPQEFNKADVIYTEPAWRHGYEKFNEKVGKEAGSYKEYLKAILNVISQLDVPAYIIGSQYMVTKMNPDDIHKVRMELHDVEAYVMLWNGADFVPRHEIYTRLDAIHYVAENYDCLLDFSCGYGGTAKVAQEHDTNFICTDINPKCTYYVATEFLGMPKENNEA